MAFRAPVLAALFLIVSLATLAMPGSANFVGEILILFGTFEDKLVYGLVASVGVVLAAVYMIRLYQGTMHGRAGPAVESRDDRPREPGGDRAAGGGDRVALGVYPQLRRAPHREGHHGRASRRRAIAGAQATPEVSAIPMSTLLAALAASQAPVIDYKELSPLFALAGGSVIVLMVGLFRGRASCSACSCRCSRAVALLTAIGLTIWIWEPGGQRRRSSRARWRSTRSRSASSMLFYVAGLVTIALSLRSTADARGRARRVPRAAARLDHRHGRARRGARA